MEKDQENQDSDQTGEQSDRVEQFFAAAVEPGINITIDGKSLFVPIDCVSTVGEMISNALQAFK